MKGMQMIDCTTYEIFSENISTLKEISLDDSQKDNIYYMTDSDKKVVDFDKVKTLYANELQMSEECAASVDGIFSTSERVVFVEFKNGKMDGQKRKVKDKLRDSLLIFCDITSKQISDTREWAEFVLVYNINKNPLPNQLKKEKIQESQSRIDIANYISNLAKKEFIRFGLEKYKTLYFKEVHTYSETEFKEYLECCV